MKNFAIAFGKPLQNSPQSGSAPGAPGLIFDL
jgi:hypothetical protein